MGTAQLSAERLGCWVEEGWIRKKGDRLQRADKADGTVEMRGKSKCTGNTAACVVTTTLTQKGFCPQVTQSRAQLYAQASCLDSSTH